MRFRGRVPVHLGKSEVDQMDGRVGASAQAEVLRLYVSVDEARLVYGLDSLYGLVHYSEHGAEFKTAVAELPQVF